VTPAAMIREAEADGVHVTLAPDDSARMVGTPEAVRAWAPKLRQHRAEILDALRAEAESTTRRHWVIRYPDGTLDELDTIPPATRAEVLARYPGRAPRSRPSSRASATLSLDRPGCKRSWRQIQPSTDPRVIARHRSAAPAGAGALPGSLTDHPLDAPAGPPRAVWANVRERKLAAAGAILAGFNAFSNAEWALCGDEAQREHTALFAPLAELNGECQAGARSPTDDESARNAEAQFGRLWLSLLGSNR